jgi:hypothetical protein
MFKFSLQAQRSGFPCQVPSVFSAPGEEQQPPGQLPLLGEAVDPPDSDPTPAASEVSYTDTLGMSDVEDASPEVVPLLARAPSLIPTEIHVPELVFGYQYPNGNCRERLPVIPFSTYAPCRLLDVDPNSPVRCHHPFNNNKNNKNNNNKKKKKKKNKNKNNNKKNNKKNKKKKNKKKKKKKKK